MTPKTPKALERLVWERARQRCEYCQASEWLTGVKFEIDHIVPRSRGGRTVADNLCLACRGCNGHKLDRVEAADPETGEVVRLFNPRMDLWHDHFSWEADGSHIRGVSLTGRATVDLLQLNRPLAVAARSVWASIGRHPPVD